MIQVKFNDKAKQVLADTLDLSGSVVVTELPQVGEEHTIYELHTTTPSIISYWIYVNGEWVNIDENLEFETQEKTVSPSTNTQKITPDEGYDGLSKVIVNAVTNAIDKNIVSGNIKKDVAILGVTGTYDGETVELQDKTVSPTTVSQEVEADVDYDGLGKVTVEAIELQDKTVSPTTTKQEVLADENYDGLSKVTIEAIELQNKEISPSTSSQSVIPDKGYDGLREVTVNAIALQDKTVTPDAVRQEITYDSNYNGLGKVIVEAVEPVELQDKTVTPTTEIQRVTADEDYYGLSKVTVEAVELQDKVTKPTTSSQEVVPDKGYVGLGKVTIDGINLQDKTVSPTTNTQKIVADENYDGLGKVTINAVTNTIDSNIKSENIKKDVSILGVTGTYEGIDEIPVPSTSLGVTYSNLRIEHPNVPNVNEAVDIYYSEEKLEINDYYVFYPETEEPEPKVAYATVSGLPQLTSEVHDFVLTIHPKMDVDTETDRLSISVNGRNVYQSQWKQEIPPEITVSVEGISQIEIDVVQLPL